MASWRRTTHRPMRSVRTREEQDDDRSFQGRVDALPLVGGRMRGVATGGAGLPDARGGSRAATLAGVSRVRGGVRGGGPVAGALPDRRISPAQHLAQPLASA